MKSLQVKTLIGVSLSEEASGTGTVTFGHNMSDSGRGSGAGRSPPPPCVESVAASTAVLSLQNMPFARCDLVSDP